MCMSFSLSIFVFKFWICLKILFLFLLRERNSTLFSILPSISAFTSPAFSANGYNFNHPTIDLCWSPSPGTVPEKPTQRCLELDDYALHNLDWNSIMNDIGFHDDTIAAACHRLHTFDQPAELTVTGDMYCYNFNYPTIDNHHNNNINGLDSIIVDLIRTGDRFDTNRRR